jgi:hypothetical protein
VSRSNVEKNILVAIKALSSEIDCDTKQAEASIDVKSLVKIIQFHGRNIKKNISTSHL